MLHYQTVGQIDYLTVEPKNYFENLIDVVLFSEFGFGSTILSNTN